ncbi:hypothetical protein N7522_006336 [Penicillium canescens]|nr:hypothetical protein N7522_006336 [Penicillium canescens]
MTNSSKAINNPEQPSTSPRGGGEFSCTVSHSSQNSLFDDDHPAPFDGSGPGQSAPTEGFGITSTDPRVNERGGEVTSMESPARVKREHSSSSLTAERDQKINKRPRNP